MNPVSKTTALAAIQTQLQALDSLDDLKAVSGLIRARWSELQRGALATKLVEGGLVQGAKVTVDLGRKGGKVEGTIRKVNAKTVVVDTQRGPYKVGASLITVKS